MTGPEQDRFDEQIARGLSGRTAKQQAAAMRRLLALAC